MLDLKFIRENAQAVKQNIINKNESADIDTFIELDEQRRAIIQQVESLKSTRNTVSEQIAVLKKSKQNADQFIEEMRIVSEHIKSFDDSLRTIESQMEDIQLRITNMVDSSVPIGKTAADNI